MPCGSVTTSGERLLADKMDGPKKGALLNLLSRTAEFRNWKLMTMLHHLGISSVNTYGNSSPITEEAIKSVTGGRNALFHSGSRTPDNVLWGYLFPLATLVVEHISSNPTCLDA